MLSGSVTCSRLSTTLFFSPFPYCSLFPLPPGVAPYGLGYGGSYGGFGGGGYGAFGCGFSTPPQQLDEERAALDDETAMKELAHELHGMSAYIKAGQPSAPCRPTSVPPTPLLLAPGTPLCIRCAPGARR